MRLNLRATESFLSRLPIRDRDTGKIVEFRANPNQKKLLDKLQTREDLGFPLWYIILKSRRVGMSAFTDGILLSHCCAMPGAEAMIVAHLAKSSKALFQIPTNLAQALRRYISGIEITQQQITIPHVRRNSLLQIATAGTVAGGRGLTLSALHLSEAAYFPSSQSFTSLLPSVQYQPHTVVAIESTANGMEGPGQAFFDYWTAAVEGRNELLPIFLSWLDDPACIRDEDEASDAPANDYEKELMTGYGASKAQIAWIRFTLETVCNGDMNTLLQEYPHCPDVAFQSSGNPAFSREELSLVRMSVTPPMAQGTIRCVDEERKEAEFIEGPGDVMLWERPVPNAHYYIGGDAAKGQDTGDFAAAVGWNAETGRQAFRYAAQIGPEALAEVINALGRYYNNAMVNIELTGGWGYIVLRDLRDTFHYPQQYFWRSRDDRPNTKGRGSMHWETTERSRRMLFDVFRTSVRRGEAIPLDEAILSQMSRAVMELGWRWTITKGHDDIFFAGLLGWIAKEQYHVPHSEFQVRSANISPESGADELSALPKWLADPFSTASGTLTQNGADHLAKLRRYDARRGRPNLLSGLEI
jgi:hypothetical protein